MFIVYWQFSNNLAEPNLKFHFMLNNNDSVNNARHFLADCSLLIIHEHAGLPGKEVMSASLQGMGSLCIRSHA